LCEAWSDHLRGIMQRLSDRLRRVRVCSGDWSRVLGPTPTTKLGTTSVFLDPPYSADASRDMRCYAVDSGTVAHDVREWCLEHGHDKLLRIALCGYVGEGHEPLQDAGWTLYRWKANGGYGSQADPDSDAPGRENALREAVWFSPHCQVPQLSIFDHWNN
jgi:hypothetical protein